MHHIQLQHSLMSTCTSIKRAILNPTHLVHVHRHLEKPLLDIWTLVLVVHDGRYGQRRYGNQVRRIEQAQVRPVRVVDDVPD